MVQSFVWYRSSEGGVELTGGEQDLLNIFDMVDGDGLVIITVPHELRIMRSLYYYRLESPGSHEYGSSPDLPLLKVNLDSRSLRRDETNWI